MMKKIWLILILITFTGCIWPFKQDPIVAHPDAPMFIMEGKVRVAIYYKRDNKLIDYGWVDAKGFTMRKYDWEKFIAKKKRER